MVLLPVATVVRAVLPTNRIELSLLCVILWLLNVCCFTFDVLLSSVACSNYVNVFQCTICSVLAVPRNNLCLGFVG